MDGYTTITSSIIFRLKKYFLKLRNIWIVSFISGKNKTMLMTLTDDGRFYDKWVLCNSLRSIFLLY